MTEAPRHVTPGEIEGDNTPCTLEDGRQVSRAEWIIDFLESSTKTIEVLHKGKMVPISYNAATHTFTCGGRTTSFKPKSATPEERDKNVSHVWALVDLCVHDLCNSRTATNA